MKTLILHGYLKDLLPDGLRIDCETVYEAIQFFANHPAIKAAGTGPGSIPIVIPGFDTVSSLKDRTSETEIHIHPTDLVGVGLSGAGGGKNGGLLKIVVGVVLIAVGVWLGPTTSWGKFLITMGANMILGGVLDILLYQKPPDPASNDQEKNEYIPARGNTTRVGTPIPLAYGTKVRLDGHFISLNVDVATLQETQAGQLTVKN